MLIPPCIPVACAFLLGLLAARSLAWPAAWIMGAAAACLLLAWSLRRPPRRTSKAGRGRPVLGLAVVLLLWACAGWLRWSQWAHQPAGHVARLVAEEPSAAAIRGVVIDDPVDAFSPGEPQQQVAVVRVLHARQSGRWAPAAGLLRARIRGVHPDLAAGDEVLLDGRWSTVPAPGNPGQFDWRAALARQRIHALLLVDPAGGVVILQEGPAGGWRSAIGSLRRRLAHLLEDVFSEEQAGLLRALLLGERVALDEELKRAFMETGTIHLLVISGFNVGLIAAMLELFLRLLGLPLRPRLLISAACLLGYWVLTGMQPPVTRATIMAWMVLLALGMDWVVNWPNVLAAAALVIIAVQPSQLWDPSFQLSFGAVLSLLALTAPLARVLEPRLPGPDVVRRYLALSLASTTAIWIGLWPLLAWYFHLITPVSVVANVVLAPLVSLLTACGTALSFLGLASRAILWAFRGLLGGLLELSMACVHVFHRIPGGSWPVGHPAWPVILGYYGLLAVSLARRHLRLSGAAVAACWLVGLNAWVWSAVVAQQRQAQWLEVTVLDVGHGDALAIRTPQGQRLLVDAGPREAGQYVIAPFLRFQGWSQVDALLLTHADEDHLGGAAAVMDTVRVRRLLTNGFVPDTAVAERIFDAARHHRIAMETVAAGQRLAGDARVGLAVLHPPAGGVPPAGLGENPNAVVLRVAYGDVSFLLCADVEDDGLRRLLRWGPGLESTVIKMPHHGSRLDEPGRELIARARPQLAVISVGWLHHLPAQETLRQLSEAGVPALLTREAGAVTLRTDGKRFIMKTFRESERE